MPKIPATQKKHGANSELTFDYLHKILFPDNYKCDGSKGQTKIRDTADKDEFSELCKSLKNICLNEKPIMQETSNSIRFSRPKGKLLFSLAPKKSKKNLEVLNTFSQLQ